MILTSICIIEAFRIDINQVGISLLKPDDNRVVCYRIPYTALAFILPSKILGLGSRVSHWITGLEIGGKITQALMNHFMYATAVLLVGFIITAKD
ncbi:hypothetical protein MKW98_027775 [Papaver atlanticum]|uniref:Uncharacterized protein n=1 Tax=Papaver atlanticum TaxID=357466 RepID=A0AAD4SZN8_9MAGN|nr:hypothetical protein MKW98_027775 [Papaver atlanticum]